MKSWLEKNNIKMYSAHNEGKSVVAERFIRTPKNKIFKYVTLISKNVYVDDTYINIDKEVNNKDPKFKVGDHVRISTYKNIFAKGYTPNWSEQIFVIKRIKNTVPWTYVISDLNGENIIGAFYEGELQKTNQKEFRIEKVIKKKGNKLYVRWKGYDNSFNSWVDKDLVK